MRKPKEECDTVEVRETGDALDRNSVFKWRKIRRNNAGDILHTDEWEITDIPSRVEVRPRVLRYALDGLREVYKKAKYDPVKQKLI